MQNVLRVLAFEIVISAILFGCAGRLDLPWVWALIAIHAAFMSILLRQMGPELIRERMRPGEGPGPRRIDAVLRRALMLVILAHLAVIGLDIRFQWSPAMPPALRFAALTAYAASTGLILWAVSANRFFSSCVRLQSDRGHKVVSTGPYGFVRHPGYLGMLAALMAECFALGSLWALLPLLMGAMVLVYRTSMEDRFLQGMLDGYRDYAGRVRYRLVPCVW